MALLFALILLVAVAAFVSRPFWGEGVSSRAEDPELAGLEAARESKYREIRDAETDLSSGKLSPEDFALVNDELRRDAVEILKKLDQVKSAPEDGSSGPAGNDQSPPNAAGS